MCVRVSVCVLARVRMCCVCVWRAWFVCVCGSLLQYCNISLVQLTSTLCTDSLPSKWSNALKPVTINAFTSPVGPTVSIPGSPLDVFQLFFTDDLLRKVVQQRNHYARQVMGDLQYHSWKQVSIHELKAFLGFSVLMGINHLPSIDDYWSKDPRLHYAPIADRIPRWRFREISRYLHFMDNDDLAPCGDPRHDRLGKVRPLIDYLSTKFASLYNPSQEIAVDEAMIKFQGRSSLKQYMPKKPIKRGIKVWVLGDSNNGYFSRFEVYSGKGEERVVGLGAHVEKNLTKELKNRNHHVFFDNFFTSYQLLVDLKKDGLYGCGTARKDRKEFPTSLKNPGLKKRYITFLSHLLYCLVCKQEILDHTHNWLCIMIWFTGSTVGRRKGEVNIIKYLNSKRCVIMTTLLVLLSI